MAEKILEKPVCQSCSADVRPGAIFCYNCGSQVAAPEAESSGNNGNIKLDLREEITESENKYATGKLGLNEIPIEKPSEDPFALPVAKKTSVQGENLKKENQIPLKSAASLRKKNRAVKRNVEIVWEPAESSPNILFIIASLVLLLLAIGILMAMLYLR